MPEFDADAERQDRPRDRGARELLHDVELAYRSSRIANQINPAILTRGRDSFAGTNTLAVNLRVPVSLIKGPAGNVVGLVAFVQRQATTRIYHPTNPDLDTSTGAYVNIDRMATPRSG